MTPSIALVNWADGTLDAPAIRSSVKKLGQLKEVFADTAALARLDPETVVYRVWWWEPVPPGTEGGLFWGTTEILPGKVGNEFFMTHGHQHAIRNRAEFYATVSGEGMLVLRDASGKTWCEPMSPGSLHYIPGSVAHRTVNSGTVPLRFIASWPSDAGHDYHTIATQGLGARVLEKNGKAVFVKDGEG